MIGDTRRQRNKRRCDNQPKRIQQLAMRARVRPATGHKRVLPARAASAMTVKSTVHVARAMSSKKLACRHAQVRENCRACNGHAWQGR